MKNSKGKEINNKINRLTYLKSNLLWKKKRDLKIFKPCHN